MSHTQETDFATEDTISHLEVLNTLPTQDTSDHGPTTPNFSKELFLQTLKSTGLAYI